MHRASQFGELADGRFGELADCGRKTTKIDQLTCWSPAGQIEARPTTAGSGRCDLPVRRKPVNHQSVEPIIAQLTSSTPHQPMMMSRHWLGTSNKRKSKKNVLFVIDCAGSG